MGLARESAVVGLPPDRAMALWLDTSRWATFVDGFARLVERADSWPEPGARVGWESRPGGRGRVTERVVEHDPPRRVAVDVFEERMIGRQTVAFEPDGDGARVSIALEYTLTRTGLLRKVVDVFFIRPRLRESQRRMLRRFAVEASEEAALPQP